MKAVLYQEPASASLRDVPRPRVGAGEALVAVEACGLCGTDIVKLSKPFPGAVLGHELAGRVAALGPSVRGLREGDRVVVAHHVPCLECHYCRRGHHPMCRQFKTTNIDPGGFAEYVRVPSLHVRHAVLKIPKGLDAVSASQTEPLACCLRNLRRMGVRTGDAVGIVGLGAIGLLTSQALKLKGAKVLGLDLKPERAAALKTWGQGFTNQNDWRRAIAKATQGRGLDSLIVTAGSGDAIRPFLADLRDGGTLSVFASFTSPELHIDLNDVYHRELTVLGSYSPSLEDLAEALDLIARGQVSIAALKPRAFPLERFDEAVGQVRSREILKAVLVPATYGRGRRP